MIRVGVLLDSLSVPEWQKQVLTFVKNDPAFSLHLAIVRMEGTRHRKQGRFFYRLLRKIDRAFFTARNDLFSVHKDERFWDGVEVISIDPIETKFTDELPVGDIDVIKSENLDLLIRFGFRILKGDVLKCAKYGVWSLHHGDNAVNRGGPPAFWEVVNREPVTGVTLQVLSEDLDGGRILGKAFVATDATSFNRNQNAVYWAGNELLCDRLKKMASDPADFMRIQPSNAMDIYSGRLYRDPGNLKALLILVSMTARVFKAFIMKSLFVQQWRLFYQAGKGEIEKSIFRFHEVIPPSGTDWADPFVISRDDKHYVFLEEYKRKNKKAHISVISFDQHGRPVNSIPKKVIDEPFHLSYPFIVQHDSSLYMIPEAAASRSVWLYRCESFPDHWVRIKELIPGVELFDPTLLNHQGHWYLFGTQKPLPGSSAHQYLHIYSTTDLLTGSWKAHPGNPVTRDVRGARPAGRIFDFRGQWIRPAQIGAPKYGYGIRFMAITKLTPEEFEEEPWQDLLPHWRNDLLATHTFNTDKSFAMIDAQVIQARFLP